MFHFKCQRSIWLKSETIRHILILNGKRRFFICRFCFSLNFSILFCILFYFLIFAVLSSASVIMCTLRGIPETGELVFMASFFHVERQGVRCCIIWKFHDYLVKRLLSRQIKTEYNKRIWYYSANFFLKGIC